MFRQLLLHDRPTAEQVLKKVPKLLEHQQHGNLESSMLLKEHPHYRIDVLTQERVVIRKTTNYVVRVEKKTFFGQT